MQHTTAERMRPKSGPPDDDDGYDDFLARVRQRFDDAVVSTPHLFTVNATNLWESYLDEAPPASRQARNCSTCKAFIERFGSLATIAPDGTSRSAIWPTEAPPAYVGASRSLAGIVEQSRVSGVFRSSLTTWGKPVTAHWTHLAVEPPKALVSSSVVANAGQEMALKAQEHEMLLRGLQDFTIELVRQAHALLTSGQLFRSEKCVGVARWLLDLHEKRAATRNERARENLTWLAVAGAGAGFCHVRSGMIGTLLEDLAAGLPFATVKARFDQKMHPLQYLRPQAEPRAGNIAQAEKIVTALKSAGALERRFARLADVQTHWMPKPMTESPASVGVFQHLKTRTQRSAAAIGAPPTVMTWTKFSTTVLPTAEQIEFLVPASRQQYLAMVTAKHPDAPPILQWDNPERRNAVSHYVYVNGSLPEHWNLRSGGYHPVTAVVLHPSLWDSSRQFLHQGGFACFVLEDARDTQYAGGAGFFPEFLRSEYHGVRKTLEAYAKAAVVEGKDEAEVCGISLSRGGSWDAVFRVAAKGLSTLYKLDRWD